MWWRLKSLCAAPAPCLVWALVLALLACLSRSMAALAPPSNLIIWGKNDDGQASPPVTAQTGVVAIAAGERHVLAITAAGKVVCWGANDVGQCNLPAETQSNIVAITCGYAHSLALNSTGSVFAWGWNSDGQSTVPARAQSGIVAIAAGTFQSEALTTAGELIAWGVSADVRTTVPSDALSGVSAIAGGAEYTLYLKGGAVYAWGVNTYGQTDVPTGAKSGIVKIAASKCHSMALNASGYIFSWGCIPATPSNAFSGIRDIATGGGATAMVITTAGKCIVWGGWNQWGQLNVPALVNDVNVTAIAANGDTTMVLYGEWCPARRTLTP